MTTNYLLETLKIKNHIINLALPKTFNSTNAYSLYLVFDGKYLMTNSENNILKNNLSNKIFVGLNNINNALRFNDLATYHNKLVKTLMTPYFPELQQDQNPYLGGQGQEYMNFITYELLSWLTINKKIKIKDLNLLGCSMGAYFSLQMLYLSNLKFKKVYLFSPSIWFNPQILNDLQVKNLNLGQPLQVNLWVGLKEPKLFEKTIATDYYQYAVKLQLLLEQKEKINVQFFVEVDGGHGFKWWINFIKSHPELW